MDDVKGKIIRCFGKDNNWTCSVDDERMWMSPKRFNVRYLDILDTSGGKARVSFIYGNPAVLLVADEGNEAVCSIERGGPDRYSADCKIVNRTKNG